MSAKVNNTLTSTLVLSIVDDPLQITANGAILPTSGDGVDGGAGTVWTITNNGTVTAPSGVGVSLASGTVTNRQAGLISGGPLGVFINGPGSVTNAGSISGTTGFGVEINGSGTVTNQGGSISGTDGIFISIGGSVTNSQGGSISGSSLGVDMNGAGTVSNNGSIGGAGFAGILLGSGTVTNRQGGSISGLDTGVQFNGAGTVTNAGTISGDDGVRIFGNGMVTNRQAGSILGGASGHGVYMNDGSGTVTNAGTISANGEGIRINGPAVVTNQAGGFISGGTNGIFETEAVAINGTGTVTNAGTITTGVYGVGVDFFSGTGTINNQQGGLIAGGSAGVVMGSGTVTNHQGATISGSEGIFFVGSGGTVTNAGTIYQDNLEGVIILGSGAVTNQQSGSILGGLLGVYIGQTGTVTNAGTISGTADSVLLHGANSRLIVDPGAVFTGEAGAEGANSTIELAKGSGAISGVGTGAFIGFATLAVDSGAKWTVNGSNTIETVTNNGSLGVAGSLQVIGSIDPTSTGLFQLGAAGVLEVAAATGLTTKMSFVSGSELIIDSFENFGQNVGAANYAGPLLEQFTAGASIDLKDFAFGTGSFTVNFNNATGVLALTNSVNQTADLQFQRSSLGAGTFHLAEDNPSTRGVLLTHA